MSIFKGWDKAGREWHGTKKGDTIEWESTDGLKGSERVVDLGNGRMRGVSTTGDVVPCDYDGETWEGDCPRGKYIRKD